jgi:ATP-dependent exoDNAse (exonuclease V) beta subunit
VSVVLADQQARDLIATALDETLVVEAAAGTGKTTELIGRVLRVIETGRAEVTRLVAVTFTEKAAGELKLRLRQELENARAGAADEVTRARLEAALRNLEEAHVSTIHGFCSDLLRERPVEAGVDPLFTVLTEAQARRLYAEAFSAWFQEVLQDPPEGVRRSLRRTSRRGWGGDIDEDGPVERLRRAGWELTDWRDFPASWARPDYDRDAQVRGLTDAVHAFAAITAQGSVRDNLYRDTAAARRTSDALHLVVGAGDFDGAEALLVDLCKNRDFTRARKGSGASYGRNVSRSQVHDGHKALCAALEAFTADADADLAALLRDELRGSIDRYQALKARAGALDFLDLLSCARDLVKHHEDVRRAFQERFSRLFVDEFQDTDPLQAELLLLLSADDPREADWRRVRPVPGKLFVVGDPKQSIYRFRRADVEIYRQVCDQLFGCGARAVQLETSFRSVPNLQGAINAAFTPLMTGDRDTLQADYVRLLPTRQDCPGQPSFVVLPVPDPYGSRKVTSGKIEKSLPDALGAFVDWLVTESGWKVSDRRRNGALVPVEARHVCVLFRRLVSWGEDLTRPYVDAFEARGVRHLLVGGRAFHDREEIETLRAALAAVEWPDDELSVFATLRGALFAIGDEELLEYHHVHRGFHPFKVPDILPEHLQPIGEALGLLAELHTRRNRRPVADTVTRLLKETRAHVGFALRRAGEQVLANALHVAELARQYELSGGISFRGFVDELREAAESGEGPEAPILEEGSDGVRLMTVHKAKGLEFPVVILADLTCRLARADAGRHLDPARGLCALRLGGWTPLELRAQQALEQARDHAEGVRLAYVAATRARDLLVVPAVGDEPFAGSWTSPLDGAIYPPPASRRDHVEAPGCPPFKKDSVLRRPDNDPALPTTVSPGLHRFEGSHETVWWDPRALKLGAEPPFGLRRHELIVKDVAPDVVHAGLVRHKQWSDTRMAALESGRTPSIVVCTATEWARRSEDPGGAPGISGDARTGVIEGPRRHAADDVPGRDPEEPRPPVQDVTSRRSSGARREEVIAFDADPSRPSGTRYGTLVHAALATVPLTADASTIARIVETQARIVAATAEEIASAAAVTRAVLAHATFDAARTADRRGVLLRETPITINVAGTLVEGVADCVFEDESGYVVIDFKTDRAEGELLDRYRRQAALYAEAVARATGKPARSVLMKV